MQCWHNTFIDRCNTHVLTFMDTCFLQGQLGINLRDDFAEEFCTAILQKAAKQRKYSCMVRI